MKNILLVFTGGTIGSKVVDDAIDTCNQTGFRLLQMFAEQDASAIKVNFSTLQPIQILSENLHPEHWTAIITAIEATEISHFDGIIVTHGTDTLAFSAAALGLYFNNLSIPMLLVSSDLPLENPLANGLPNFRCAVEFIRQIQTGGVFVAYQNRNQAMHVYIATRLASCLQLSSDFIGVQSGSFMSYVDGTFKSAGIVSQIERQNVPCKAIFSKKILLIRPYPGLDYSQFNLNGVKVILHDLYHSGTACTSASFGEQHNLSAFIRHCKQHAVKIYLAPGIRSENSYSSTKELLEQGATMIWNMSLEAAYAKLLLAYGNFEDEEEIENFLEQTIALEHL
jgi:L-asparaginase